MLRIVWVAVFVFCLPSIAQAASFDCDAAVAADTAAICAHPALSARDDQAAALARADLAAAPAAERDGLTHSRRAWLRARARCQGDLDCLKRGYDAEIGRLTSLEADLATAAHDPGRLAAILRFRQSAQCASCNLSSAVLSYMQPARNVVSDEERCTIHARARGDFGGAKLDHADLTTCAADPQSRLASLDWDGVRMRWADLRGITFGVASLRGADLSGADLTGAVLAGVDLTGATLRRANSDRCRQRTT